MIVLPIVQSELSEKASTISIKEDNDRYLLHKNHYLKLKRECWKYGHVAISEEVVRSWIIYIKYFIFENRKNKIFKDALLLFSCFYVYIFSRYCIHDYNMRI